MAFTIKVNGTAHSVDVDGDTPLLWLLRGVLGMTGTKFGCGMALCAACTVQINGEAVRSCITSIDSIGDAKVTTIEAVGKTPAGQKIQAIWLDREVSQCGYCQSGQSCRRPHCLQAMRIRRIRTSLMRCRAIFAAAEHVRVPAKRSSKPHNREADHDAQASLPLAQSGRERQLQKSGRPKYCAAQQAPPRYSILSSLASGAYPPAHSRECECSDRRHHASAV